MCVKEDTSAGQPKDLLDYSRTIELQHHIQALTNKLAIRSLKQNNIRATQRAQVQSVKQVSLNIDVLGIAKTRRDREENRQGSPSQQNSCRRSGSVHL